MHLVDRAAGFLVGYGPRRLRTFTAGWGDRDTIERIRGLSGHPPERLDIDPLWSEESVDGDVVIRDGTWPASPELHEEGRTGAVRSIAPAGGTDRWCVLMAAWNDHGYATRSKIAGDLAGFGIGSLIPENPYYGTRRPAGRSQPIATVADFAVMGYWAIAETMDLAGWLHRRGQRVGVAGYSMGGNMAAMAGAALEFPAAIAPLAASHSPGPVFLYGVLQAGIAWDELGGRDNAGLLVDLLMSISALHYPATPQTRNAIIVGASSDGFIPRQATLDLHAHWPGSELRWERGGHATLLWFRRDRLVAAIVDSFERASL